MPTPRRPARIVSVVAVLAGALALVLSGPARAAATVTVGGATHDLTGTDVYRSSNALVLYTPARGATTGTNQYGFEAAVVDGKVTKVEDGIGNMAIPADGVVLSGNGTSRTWLRTNAKVGTSVVLPGDTPGGGGSGGTTVPPDTNQVSVNGAAHAVTGIDVRRRTEDLIVYTPAFGANTGTNQYGFEAAVVDGRITRVENGVGSMAIPTGGYVLSGHGEPRTWLRSHATVGATVTLSGGGSGGSGGGSGGGTATALLPDVAVRTLGGFTIVNANGRRLLKFPGVTVNVGDGPLEIKGTRSSATSDDWVARQVVSNSDGTKTTLPSTGATFYYAGDGHSHWHIRDFDAYELFNGGGQKLRDGEKHGFCFEDNTSYRDWPSKGTNGAPANPVYTHEASCGEGHPEATTITHGLSVGWGDTYPTTLPDQAIDITNLPDGVYEVRITADWQHFWKEKNDANNASSAQIRISGSTVSVISTSGGL